MERKRLSPETAARLHDELAPQVVSIYLDDSKVGSGYRRMLVLNVGTKWAHLFYVPLLTKVTLPKEDFLRFGKPVESNPRTLLKLVRANQKIRDQNGLGYSEPATEAAEAILAAALQ